MEPFRGHTSGAALENGAGKIFAGLGADNLCVWPDCAGLLAARGGNLDSTGFDPLWNDHLYGSAADETEDTLVIDTTLIGPGKAENVTKTPTRPYIVVKTRNIADKMIEFK